MNFKYISFIALTFVISLSQAKAQSSRFGQKDSDSKLQLINREFDLTESSEFINEIVNTVNRLKVADYFITSENRPSNIYATNNDKKPKKEFIYFNANKDEYDKLNLKIFFKPEDFKSDTPCAYEIPLSQQGNSTSNEACMKSKAILEATFARYGNILFEISCVAQDSEELSALMQRQPELGIEIMDDIRKAKGQSAEIPSDTIHKDPRYIELNNKVIAARKQMYEDLENGKTEKYRFRLSGSIRIIPEDAIEVCHSAADLVFNPSGSEVDKKVQAAQAEIAKTAKQAQEQVKGQGEAVAAASAVKSKDKAAPVAEKMN